jgi:hypothetical protein
LIRRIPDILNASVADAANLSLKTKWQLGLGPLSRVIMDTTPMHPPEPSFDITLDASLKFFQVAKFQMRICGKSFNKLKKQ